MIKLLHKIRSKLKRGDGEIIGAVVIMIMLCFMCIYLCSFVITTTATNSLSKAATVAARSAAVCNNVSDATEAAKTSATNSITNIHISDIGVNLELVGDTGSWEVGGYLKVTVSGYVDTLTPFISGTRSKSMVVCIEDDQASEEVVTEEV